MSRTSTAPMAPVFQELPADKSGIRPLRVNVPEEELRGPKKCWLRLT